jgi:prevent-host-death family protein
MTTIQIPIRELHARTGHFVRLASSLGEIIITEHGKPAARISPIGPGTESELKSIGQRRRLRPDYLEVKRKGRLTLSTDSTPELIETASVRDL